MTVALREIDSSFYARSDRTKYSYDALSRLLSVVQHLGQSVSYEYDDRGRLDLVTNTRANVLDYTHTPWGALAQVEHFVDVNATTPSRTLSYGFDLEGNLTSASDDDPGLGVSGPLFTVDPTTGYDARNRLHEIVVHYLPGEDVTLTSDYNRFGERAQLVLTRGAESPLTHTWSFDALGRLDLASFPGSGALDFTPFPDDSLQTIARASGVLTDFTQFSEGPIDTISVMGPGSTQLNLLDYAVNAVLNVTDLAEQHASGDPTHSYVYGYDGANRLTDADYPAAYGLPALDDAFTYDPAGNREAQGDPNLYDYDANNRIALSPGVVSYSFDDDGNLTARTGATFGFDFTNQLRSFDQAGTAAAYADDPFGRRLKKTVNGVTTWYLWDGDQLLAEYDGSGARQVRYAYAGGFAPAQVAYTNGSGEDVYDVHADHLDTPRLLTDAAGAVVWRAAYEAFGKAHLDPANTVTFNLRFPGQYYDAESGLHSNRFRYYDPAIGRYVSADPIGQFGFLGIEGIPLPGVAFSPEEAGSELLLIGVVGSNVYNYVLGDPLNLIDHLGLGGLTEADKQRVREQVAAIRAASAEFGPLLAPLCRFVACQFARPGADLLRFQEGEGLSQEDLDFIFKEQQKACQEPGSGDDKKRPELPATDDPAGRFNGRRNTNDVSHSRGPKGGTSSLDDF